MTLPIVTRGQLRVLAALAGGARLATSRNAFVLRRGRHVRGVRLASVGRLQGLLLIRGGRITDAGRLVLAAESCR